MIRHWIKIGGNILGSGIPGLLAMVIAQRHHDIGLVYGGFACVIIMIILSVCSNQETTSWKTKFKLDLTRGILGTMILLFTIWKIWCVWR